WLSSATLLERMNFAVALTGNKIGGARMDVSRFAPSASTNDPNRFIDQLVAALVHSDVSPDTRENLARVLSETRAKAAPAKFDGRAPQKNIEMAAALTELILGSGEFQVK
ncbi:MAG TPA: DUF1800 family protein, partial [Blastocatellia bacterium]